MTGTTGDALCYEVEFMNRRAIISRFGENGITKFALDHNGKALISNDTQMTLFTTNGLLNTTRLQIESQYAIVRAYIDWYYTINGVKMAIIHPHPIDYSSPTAISSPEGP